MGLLGTARTPYQEMHTLIHLLVCPRTKSSLTYIELGEDAGLISQADGVLYPIIDNVVVMKPSGGDVQKMCADFLERNDAALSKLGNGYEPALTRSVLFPQPDDTEAQWHREEMAYWEVRFKKTLEMKKQGNPAWNRTLPRKKILNRLTQELSKRVILELGCGASHTLLDVYGKNLRSYIGFDLSFYACRLAQRLFPHGLYVQASAESLPFRDESVDAVFVYGILHHLPNHERNVPSILSVIRSNGYLIGFDPMSKPRISRTWRKRKSQARDTNQMGGEAIDLRSGRSPHNEWIDWGSLLKIIRNKAEVVEVHHEYGPLRGVLVQMLHDRLGLRSKFVIRAMMAVDQLWLATVGKLHRAIGPGAIHYALRKY